MHQQYWVKRMKAKLQMFFWSIWPLKWYLCCFSAVQQDCDKEDMRITAHLTHCQSFFLIKGLDVLPLNFIPRSNDMTFYNEQKTLSQLEDCSDCCESLATTGFSKLQIEGTISA